MPLERTVVPRRPLTERLSEDVVEFDASPFGGGAARRRGSQYIDWFAVTWSAAMVGDTGAEVGKPSSQSFWEFFALLAVLLVYSEVAPGCTLQILGDNTASLQQSLRLRGRGAMLAISRELSWRQARFHWRFAVAHLPTERNAVADALSRLSGPSAADFPAALAGKPRLVVPDLCAVWQAAVDVA